MKFINFKQDQVYTKTTNLGDETEYFKKVGDDYYTVNAKGKWEKTQELSLADEFAISNDNPGIESFSDMYHLYVTGDANTQQVYLHKLLRTMAQKMDEL